MSIETLVGLIVLALPLVVLFSLLFRRRRPIFLFALALIVVGLGYLAATGAAADIGHWALQALGSKPAVKPAGR
jgi:hypothetical protein